MNNPILSFIIPVYNTAQWLRPCVDSVLGQHTAPGQIEIILVDDGSTDESPSICDAFGEKHPDIRVIHKKNGGLSDARNAGIAMAKGHYLTFLDSDDLIAPEALSTLLPFLKREEDACPQLVFLEISDLLPDGATGDYGLHFQRDRLQNRSREEVLAYLSSLPKNPITACGKLIDRQLMAKNEYRFDPGWRSGEDLDFSLGLFMICQRFDCCGGDFYRYRRIREGSITHTTDLKKLNETLAIMEKWIRRAEDQQSPWREAIFAFLSYTYIVMLGVFCRVSDPPHPAREPEATHGEPPGQSAAKNQGPPPDKKHTWRRLQKNKFLLRYGRGKKSRLIRVLHRLIGLKLTSVLLGRYLAWR